MFNLLLPQIGTQKAPVNNKKQLKRISDEGRPNIEDAIRSGEIQLVINTPVGRQAAHDDKYLRRAAIDYAVTTVTTLAGARAAVEGIAALQAQELQVRALQDIHG